VSEGIPKRDARSLVETALAQSAPAPVETAAASAEIEPVPASPSDEDVAVMIETYFELESPIERDALFDQLAAISHPQLDAFLRTMMTTDEDEYLRSAAAAELAKRGDAAAIAVIEADLEDPQEPHFFEQAIEVLSQVRGRAFYTTLTQIWQDPDRDADQRRIAMVAMESLDAEQALTDFVNAIDATTDISTMADDLIEGAMLAFVRHAYRPAEHSLSNLRDRIAAAPLDEEERAELIGFIQEGLDLLAGSY
jgi:HEAT repeat protein